PSSLSLSLCRYIFKETERDQKASIYYSELDPSRSYPLVHIYMPMAAAAAARKVSVPAILLALSVLSCLLLVHAAAAGNRKALLPRWAAAGDDGGQVVLSTTAEEAAVGAAGGESHHHLLAGEGEVEARRAELLQTQDYPGSGANSRHDPRNPH
ncbi:unnamed protein product, partial [Urochloa humidicola]